MRGVGVDGLVVVPGVTGAVEHDDLPVLVVGRVRGVQVVPVEHDGGLAARDRRGGHVDLEQVSGLLQLGEEVDARLEVVERAVGLHGGEADGGEGRTGLGRVAVDRDGALVVGREQVGEFGRSVELRRVVADRHVPAVVADEEAGGLLQLLGDVVPGLHLVGREDVGVLQGDREADVEHVGRGVEALVGLRRLDLLGARDVGGGLVDGDLGVLLGEQVEDLAVVRPVAGERDDVERAFGLGCSLEVGEGAEVGDRGRGGGVDVGAASAGRVSCAGAGRECECGRGGQGDAGADARAAGEASHECPLGVRRCEPVSGCERTL